MSNSWNLEDGLKLVRALQPDTRQFGYHLALGGGVLNNGQSSKDIDLYFLPLDNSKLAKPNPGALIDWLVKMWGDYEPIGGDYGQPESVSFDLETIQPLFSDSPLLTPWDNDWQAAPVKAKIPITPSKDGSYQYKLKFNRKGDRIDVFIV